MASDAREITEARTRYAEEVASVVAPRGAGSKRRGHSGQGSPNQAGAEIAGGTDGSRTLPWSEPDSNWWSRRKPGPSPSRLQLPTNTSSYVTPRWRKRDSNFRFHVPCKGGLRR